MITKEEAICQGKNRFFDGMPCRKGHISEKYVRKNYCCECKKISEVRNSESRKASVKTRYIKNREFIIAKNAEYVKHNRELVAVRQTDWRSKNKDKILKYQKDNAALYAFHAAKRRAKVRRATPPWANMDAIKSFYFEAARLTKITGIPHDVDHIVPITHEYISGLHCEFNLQILTEQENSKKHNHFTI